MQVGNPWFLGDTWSALDIYLWQMQFWRPGRDWFTEFCPKLHAIGVAMSDDPTARRPRSATGSNSRRSRYCGRHVELRQRIGDVVPRRFRADEDVIARSNTGIDVEEPAGMFARPIFGELRGTALPQMAQKLMPKRSAPGRS